MPRTVVPSTPTFLHATMCIHIWYFKFIFCENANPHTLYMLFFYQCLHVFSSNSFLLKMLICTFCLNIFFSYVCSLVFFFLLNFWKFWFLTSVCWKIYIFLRILFYILTLCLPHKSIKLNDIIIVIYSAFNPELLIRISQYNMYIWPSEEFITVLPYLKSDIFSSIFRLICFFFLTIRHNKKKRN